MDGDPLLPTPPRRVARRCHPAVFVLAAVAAAAGLAAGASALSAVRAAARSPPAPRKGSVAAVLPPTGRLPARLVVWSGKPASLRSHGGDLRDCHALPLDGRGRWQAVDAGSADGRLPRPRWKPVAVAVPSTGAVVVFGGDAQVADGTGDDGGDGGDGGRAPPADLSDVRDDYLGDLWRLSLAPGGEGAEWSRAEPSGGVRAAAGPAPCPRRASMGALLPEGLIGGGGDSWTLGGGGPAPHNASAPNAAPGTVPAANADGALLVHGGRRSRKLDGLLGDLWAAPLGRWPAAEWVRLWPSAECDDNVRSGGGGGLNGAAAASGSISPANASFITTTATARPPRGHGCAAPAPRKGHAGAVLPAGTAFPSSPALVIVGGRNDATAPYFGDVWAFDLAARVWADLTPRSGPAPPPADHGGAFVDHNGRLILLGGRGGASYAASKPLPLSDAWAFDARARVWTRLPRPAGPAPAPRFLFGLGTHSTPGGDTRAVVFGGEGAGGRYLADAWEYSVAANAWTPLPSMLPLFAGAVPSPAAVTLLDSAHPEPPVTASPAAVLVAARVACTPAADARRLASNGDGAALVRQPCGAGPRTEAAACGLVTRLLQGVAGPDAEALRAAAAACADGVTPPAGHPLQAVLRGGTPGGDACTGLVAWAQAEGVQAPALAPAVFDGGLRGAAATRDIAPEDVLVSLPTAALISEATVDATELGNSLASIPGLDAESRLLAFTLADAADLDSPRAPVWACLRGVALVTGLAAPDSEATCLADTPVGARLGEARAHVRAAHTAACPLLAAMARQSVLRPEQTTLDAYLWAVQVWYAYAVDVRLLDGGPPTPCLAPLAFLLNHSPWPHAVRYGEVEAGCLTVRACRRAAAGDQLFLSYGPKTNAELLLFYGFAVPDNPDDRVEIDLMEGLGASAEGRERLLAELGLAPTATLAPPPATGAAALLAAARVLCAGKGEAAALLLGAADARTAREKKQGGTGLSDSTLAAAARHAASRLAATRAALDDAERSLAARAASTSPPPSPFVAAAMTYCACARVVVEGAAAALQH